MPELQPVRLGTVWMRPARADGRAEAAGQLELLDSASRGRPMALDALDQRTRGTSFHALPVRSVLNTPAATGMGFWSLNPYIGCEFGCTYCYARDTHRYTMERLSGSAEDSADPSVRPSALPAWQSFERRILVKLDAAQVLARTLDPAKLAGHQLVIGTATDPYQPAERRFRITRRILETLLGWRALSIGIITKSPLIVRDLDVLQDLARRHEVTVSISLVTLDARLARRLELRSPVPAARLRALRRLTDAGIPTGLFVAPIIPCITDGREALDALFSAAKEAGARSVMGAALRLAPAARRRFLPYLRSEFPNLAERYERHYAGRHSVDRAYQTALTRRLRALKRKYGFPSSRQDDEPAIETAAAGRQLTLFGCYRVSLSSALPSPTPPPPSRRSRSVPSLGALPRAPS
jgi:DNA repair photolyase